MSNADVIGYLKYGSIACYIFAGLFLILAIALFFLFKIPDVINEISGKAKNLSTEKMVSGYKETGSLRTDVIGTASKAPPDDKKNGRAGPKKNGKPKTEQTKPARQTTALKTEGPSIRKVTAEQNKTAGRGFIVTKDVIVLHTDERI